MENVNKSKQAHSRHKRKFTHGISFIIQLLPTLQIICTMKIICIQNSKDSRNTCLTLR